MSLAAKFNVILVVVFTLALVPAGLVSHALLQDSAREQVLANARIMMDTALAVRGYTLHQIRPLLDDKMAAEFLPQSVPAYSATEIFAGLQEKNPEYTYKEATLNPSNPRDRTVDWEADVVNEFRAVSSRKEIIGERDTPQGRALFLAHPIQIKDAKCLSCHTTPEEAPPSMIRRYGPGNGFGWKLDEVVGAQIISVPMSVPVRAAQRAFWTLMAALVAVFLATLVVLNLLMRVTVIGPLRLLATTADQVSMGNLDAPPVVVHGRDEMARLAESFNRMRISLEKAIAMLDDDPGVDTTGRRR